MKNEEYSAGSGNSCQRIPAKENPTSPALRLASQDTATPDKGISNNIAVMTQENINRPRILVNNLMKWKKPQYVAQEMGISEVELRKELYQYGIPADWGEHSTSVAMALRANISTFETITSLINSATPKKQKDKFIYAEKYANTDDLIQSICTTKADFGMANFHVQSPDKAVQDFCDKTNRIVDMDAIVQNMWVNISSMCNAPFYYELAGNEIVDIQIVNPSLLEVIPLYQMKNGRRLKAAVLHLPEDLKATYRKREQTGYKELKALQEAMKDLPQEYKKALNNQGVGAGLDGIEIEESENKFLRIINHKGLSDRLVDPEMVAVFKQIRLRQLMQEGDFAINHHIKSMIHQIKVGKKVGQHAQQYIAELVSTMGLTEPQMAKLLNAYKSIEKVLVEVTDDTIEHLFLAPDPKYLDGKKYVPVELQILRWGRIALVLLDAEGANYSGGYIYIKALIADIMKCRNRIRRGLQQFYMDIAPTTGRGALQQKFKDEATRPNILFSDNIMKEPKQLLDEVRFMMTQGGMDWQTAHEWLGVSHMVTRERMQQMWEEEGSQYWYPLYEMHQGLVLETRRYPVEPVEPVEEKPNNRKPGEPGNPPKDNEQRNRDNLPRQPRPGRKSPA